MLKYWTTWSDWSSSAISIAKSSGKILRRSRYQRGLTTLETERTSSSSSSAFQISWEHSVLPVSLDFHYFPSVQWFFLPNLCLMSDAPAKERNEADKRTLESPIVAFSEIENRLKLLNLANLKKHFLLSSGQRVLGLPPSIQHTSKINTSFPWEILHTSLICYLFAMTILVLTRHLFPIFVLLSKLLC